MASAQRGRALRLEIRHETYIRYQIEVAARLWELKELVTV
jgi:hypothetical protein